MARAMPRPPATPAPAVRRDAARTPRATTSPTTREPDAPAPRSAQPGPEEIRRIILETHERLAERTYYEVLGIERGASDAEVRQAHARLVRALHPGSCSGPEFDDIQEQRAAVFVRVEEAFEALRDLHVRAAYDKHLKLSKPETTPTPADDPARRPPNRLPPGKPSRRGSTPGSRGPRRYSRRRSTGTSSRRWSLSYRGSRVPSGPAHAAFSPVPT